MCGLQTPKDQSLSTYKSIIAIGLFTLAEWKVIPRQQTALSRGFQIRPELCRGVRGNEEGEGRAEMTQSEQEQSETKAMELFC